jgi:hypothetical protein
VLDGKVRVQTDAGEMEFDLVNIDKARVVPNFDMKKSGDRLV